MQRERFKIVSYVSLILRKGDDVLLIRRYQTGSNDGLYACAGGGVDGNEPVTHAIIREAREELGIELKKKDLRVVHVLHSKNPTNETIGFFIEAAQWEGEPRNMEPHKCDDVKWMPAKALPENSMPHLKQVMHHVERNSFYSEFGWREE
jgi:8-oxo-dGTP diphosphatase